MALGPNGRTQFAWTAEYDPARNEVLIVVTEVVSPMTGWGGSNPTPGPAWTGNIKFQVSRKKDFSVVDYEYTCAPPAKSVYTGHGGLDANEITYIRIAGSISGGWTDWSPAKIFITPTGTYVTVNGEQKTADIFVRVGNVWRPAVKYVKVGGVWTNKV